MVNPPAPEKKSLILVVDDHWMNRELMQDVLAAYGYEVVLAHNGAQALEISTTRQPALILMDVRMPDMTGYEVCRRLKAADATRAIPVVITTALMIDREEQNKATEVAADGIISRIVPADELMNYIAGVLNRENTGKAGPEHHDTGNT
jgi:CheY-like chemotaxis protein